MKMLKKILLAVVLILAFESLICAQSAIPQITGPYAATFTAGQQQGITINAVNATYVYLIEGMPAGLTLGPTVPVPGIPDRETFGIGGTPLYGGVYSIGLEACCSQQSVEQFFTLTIIGPPAPPLLTPPLIATSQNGTAILRAGDFRHRGRLDVAVTQGQYFCVLLNDGIGDFVAPSCQHQGIAVLTGLALVDWNRDGNLDAVTSSSVGVQVWLGDGAGNFSFGSQPSNASPSGLVAGNFAGAPGVAFGNCTSFYAITNSKNDNQILPGCGRIAGSIPKIGSGDLLIVLDVLPVGGFNGLSWDATDDAITYIFLYNQAGNPSLIFTDTTGSYLVSYDSTGKVVIQAAPFSADSVTRTRSFYLPAGTSVVSVVPFIGTENKVGLAALLTSTPPSNYALSILSGPDWQHIDAQTLVTGNLINPTAEVSGNFFSSPAQDIAVLDQNGIHVFLATDLANGIPIGVSGSFSSDGGTLSSIVFPPTPLGILVSKSVRFTNTGTAGADLTIALTGSTDLTETNDCPANLGPAVFCTIDTHFVPSTLLPVSAILTAGSGFSANAPVTGSTLTRAPQITSANTATFTVGTNGIFMVTASGSPISTYIESGALPAGVLLASDGILSGIPATGTQQNYIITITATNGILPEATQNFTLVVNSALVPLTAPQFTSANTATFTTGTAGSFTITATGNPAPTLAESGVLPSGVSFTSGVLNGAPTTAGNYPILFTAHNGVGADAIQNFTLTIQDAPNFTLALSPSSQNAAPGATVTYLVTVSGNAGSVSLSCLATVSCSLNPAQITSGTAALTVSAPMSASGLLPRFPSLKTPLAGFVWLLPGFLLAFLTSLTRYRRLIPAFGIVLVLALILAGCSGGGAKTTNAPSTAKTYTVTVSGTATVRGAVTVKTQTAMLVVQ